MKLLFDTHSFLWWDFEQQSLSPKALAACQDPNNTLLFSAACAWEIQIKSGIGKLNLPKKLSDLVKDQ
jgi:PIN domain nuclease of toxin-antitoxin system